MPKRGQAWGTVGKGHKEKTSRHSEPVKAKGTQSAAPATPGPPAASRLLSPPRGQVTGRRRGGGGGAGRLRAHRRGAGLGPHPPAHPTPRTAPTAARRLLPPAAPSAPSSASGDGFRKRGPAGTAQLSPAGEQRREEFSTSEGRPAGPVFSCGAAVGPAVSSRARAEERLGAVGERAAATGPGRQVPRRPPRPAPSASRKRKPPGRARGPPAGPRRAGAPWLGEARDLVRPKVDLTGCQHGSPPPPPSGSLSPGVGPHGHPRPRLSLSLALSPPGAPPLLELVFPLASSRPTPRLRLYFNPIGLKPAGAPPLPLSAPPIGLKSTGAPPPPPLGPPSNFGLEPPGAPPRPVPGRPPIGLPPGAPPPPSGPS
ncbi:basic proline-rich protein-like [Eumetopias jubatus]|uniref:basic proline-rich protein-like n=1 Tax=Eumetopias jubatus TaxID=34886 RepID=UPI0010164918|nr:basic proline-rich protein-like [Eumetopias jubatus]